MNTGRAPVEAEIMAFDGFLESFLEPRDLERDYSLEDRLE
jgi:hypothetical protein